MPESSDLWGYRIEYEAEGQHNDSMSNCNLGLGWQAIKENLPWPAHRLLIECIEKFLAGWNWKWWLWYYCDCEYWGGASL